MPPVHDYVLDNATGANFRSDLNNALAAIVSNNSSSTEPSTKYAYQWWADTNEGVLKIRNSSNDGWVTLLQLDGTLTLEDGSNSAPALGFRDDLNTGIFSSAADTLDITCGGTTRGSFSSSGLTVTGTCSATTLTGTLSTAAQTNVTSLGTLTGLTLSGDMTFTGDSANVQFDKSDSALEFLDNAKAKFGNGDDLQLYHDGSNSFIADAGTGSLVIQTNALAVKNAAGSENLLYAQENAEVQLMFDNSTKFETYSNGVRAANNGHIKLASDSGKFFMGAGDDAELFFDGTNLFLNGDGTNDTFLRAKSGENSIKLVPDGAVELYFNNGKKFETASYGAVTTGTFQATGNIEVFDNGKFIAGLGSDLQLYHDGTNSYIANATGGLRLSVAGGGNQVQINKGTVDENMAKFIADGAVELYYNNSKRFETISDGAKISGNSFTIEDTGDVNLNLKADSDNADETHNPAINFFQDGGSQHLKIGIEGTSGTTYSNSGNNTSYIITTSTTNLHLGTNNTAKWFINTDGHFKPNADNSYDIGSSSNRIRNIYTGDLNLSNEGSSNDVDSTWGSYTIQEGAEDLFLINKRNGKKYKFNLTEVN